MPVTLTQVAAQPDRLGTDRHGLVFGVIPGVPDAPQIGQGGTSLLINHAEVTLPPITLGQVRVPAFGFPRAFRGHIDHGNRWQASFYETVYGGTAATIIGWLNKIRPFDGSPGLTKAEYAVDCEYTHYNTLGRPAYVLTLTRVFPLSFTYPENTEESQPVHIQCEFSLDEIRLKSVGQPLSDSDRATIESLRRRSSTRGPAAANATQYGI